MNMLAMQDFQDYVSGDSWDIVETAALVDGIFANAQAFIVIWVIKVPNRASNNSFDLVSQLIFGG